MNILVVDGNSIMHRAYWATMNLTNGAVLTFLNMLHKTEKEVNADSIIVAFDVHAPTFRHKMYEDYKAGRRPTPDELIAQFPIIKEILESLGADIVEAEGFEADDILGAVACKYKNDNVYIMTGDKDALQLVKYAKVILANVGQNRTYDEELLEKDYGLTANQFIEYKALIGDKSDNIIGADGIGDKTAQKLLSEYGSIDNIYKNLEKLTPKVKQSLENFKPRLSEVLRLVAIDCNVPIEGIELKKHDFYSHAFLENLLKYNLKNLHNRLLKESQISSDEQIGFL